MIPRILAKKLKRDAGKYPAVALTGPRQSGKTTLVRAAFPKHDYVSLEAPDRRAFALEDPRGFLSQFRGSAILDEIQRAPDLFSYIQTIVDEEDRTGRFILTGSQNFLLLESVSQSLAGRCAVLHLHPFSLAELRGRKPMDLEALGTSQGLAKSLRNAKSVGSEDAKGKRVGKTSTRGTLSEAILLETLFAGFYPRIHDRRLPPDDWLGNYYQTYLERDVRNLLNVGDIDSFGRFVRLCAGRNGQLLNLVSLASDCGISHTTARRWLSALEASFLVVLLRPFHENFGKRLTKSPKLYFMDTGLLCRLLNVRSPEELLHRSERGAVFESFVVSELVKNFTNRGLRPPLYFWRDSAGHEVDAIVDFGARRVAVEMKSGQTLAGDSFSGFKRWRKISGDAAAPLALIYGGEDFYMREGVAALPWFAL